MVSNTKTKQVIRKHLFKWPQQTGCIIYPCKSSIYELLQISFCIMSLLYLAHQCASPIVCYQKELRISGTLNSYHGK